ncbi:DUF5908 family protein [Methylogaea oryzae]|uniref:DUF5908 family protein n=1 Tax=Methylogaea oryzae TaxID=1295382 RepID=UPI001C3F4B0E|nr:DUF5908 family protein [Methylogaea oryzae]
MEIRELVIRAVVAEPSEGSPPSPSEREPEPALDQSAVVQECVKQVLKILRRDRER